MAVDGGYGIDATEVTRDQYEAWLGTGPSTAGQESYCLWNTDFAAGSDCMGGSDVCQGVGCGSHPQGCVDWCDAYAYCKGVGKRLCGKIGGGSNAWNDDGDYTKSQWLDACSSGGANTFPYGNSFEASTCNGEHAGHGSTVPVASMAGCQSSAAAYEGVYDLGGNVWEWEDSCIGPDKPDFCHCRGGSFVYGDDLRCVVMNGFPRDYRYGYVGFRCCSDP